MSKETLIETIIKELTPEKIRSIHDQFIKTIGPVKDFLLKPDLKILNRSSKIIKFYKDNKDALDNFFYFAIRFDSLKENHDEISNIN